MHAWAVYYFGLYKLFNWKKKTLHWFILRDALKNLILYFVKVFKNICPILFNTKNWKRD